MENNEPRLLDPDVQIVLGALDPDRCRRIIEAAELIVDEAWQISYTSSEAQSLSRVSRRVVLQEHQDLAEHDAAVFEALTAAVQSYVEHVNPHVNVDSDTAYEVVRYRPGCYSAEHVDSNPALEARFPSSPRRQLAMVLFLNRDYEGGRFVFPRRILKLTPPPGSLILFPAGISWPHLVEPVKSGTRWVLASWLYLKPVAVQATIHVE